VGAAVVVLLAGACGGGGGAKSSAPSTTGPSTSAPAGGGLGPTGTDAAGVPTTVKPGTPPKPGAPTTAAPRQRRPGVPAPGRYMYSTGTTQNAVRAFDVHEDAGQTGNDIVHLFTWIDRDSAERSVVTWRPDSRVLDREQKATPDEQGDLNAGPVCDWEPDVVELRLPLAVGQSWSNTVSCVMDGTKRERTTTAKVTATDTLTVEGEQVPVMVIERVVTDVQRLAIGPFTTKTTTTESYSPHYGIIVKATGTIEQTVAVKTSSSTFQMDLKSVRPTPTPS
jgi:hypothetical protein